LKSVIVGPVLPTVKPLLRLATSVPVVIVTVRPPGVAVPKIVMLTVACVASDTVVEFTVIPAPKLATVVL
jgi:hypothetical protein